MSLIPVGWWGCLYHYKHVQGIYDLIAALVYYGKEQIEARLIL